MLFIRLYIIKLYMYKLIFDIPFLYMALLVRLCNMKHS